MAIGLTGGKARRAIHPVVVFALKLWQEFPVGGLPVMLGKKIDHECEIGRLGTAEVIGARAVGNMAVAVDQRRHVLDHAAHQVELIALVEADHREIRVPVIQLREAAARHDIGMRQRQKRGIGDGLVRLPRQHAPHALDVIEDILVRAALVSHLPPDRG